MKWFLVVGTAVVVAGCRSGGAGGVAMEPDGPSATFDVRHEITVPIPEDARRVRVWITRPQRDPAQAVRRFRLETNVGARAREATDSEGNAYTFYELEDPGVDELRVVNTFRVERREWRSGASAERTRPYRPADLEGKERYLEANRHVVIDDRVRRLAAGIVGDERNPVRAARRIYDWVLENVQYWVKDPTNLAASKVGSTEYCLAKRTGNCTDFHSLYLSLARAAGIPSRIAYGSLFKEPLDGVDQDQSYHCWIEFWAPKLGWVPLDVAVADIFVGDFRLTAENESKVALTTADGYAGPDRARVDYYFGNLDARRVTWTRGRDLELRPQPAGGPVNAMAKAYVEIDGKEAGYGRKLTYKEVG